MEEKHGFFLEDLDVGMTAVYAKTITDAGLSLRSGSPGVSTTRGSGIAGRGLRGVFVGCVKLLLVCRNGICMQCEYAIKELPAAA